MPAEGDAALAARTGDTSYITWIDTWWDFIETHFVASPGGRPENWQHELDASNRPIAQVWSGKPDVYHGYQALLLTRHPAGRSLADRLLSKTR